MKGKNIIISGGGTAGHLYPALAVGRKLKEKDPHVHLIYVGSSRGLEKTIMDHHGADFIPLKIEGLKGKGVKIIKPLLLLPFSFLKSLIILIRFKPRLVMGMGGYSSGPIVLLASLMKKPTLIMEQNFKPGFTNRILIPWVRKAVVAFQGSLPSFKGKGVFIGNPVREEFYRLKPKGENSHLTLLIFGGSQGSHFLNQAVIKTLPLLSRIKDRVKIIHQTGEKDWEWVKNNYLDHSFKHMEVAPFFHNMAGCFQRADLIISRAGATTIAEIIASQKASLLIPFSKASENHQLSNARQLEKTKAAEVILEEEVSPETLSSRIMDFLKQREKIHQMKKNLKSLQTGKVADRIADLCFELMETQP
ncbi:MAG: undecaprenyldiphospho-muramoylpentapeptide beta-N-acetylglucosaminyltransferase [Candidatus Aminicenantes bacterium]